MIANRLIGILAAAFFGLCTLTGIAGGLNAFPISPRPQAASPTPTGEQASAQDKKEAEAQEKIKQLQKELEDQKKRLEVARHEAAAAKAKAEALEYLNRLALAQQQWQANELFRANQILDECTPASRGWEWHYLKRLFHGSAPARSLGCAQSTRSRTPAAAGLLTLPPHFRFTPPPRRPSHGLVQTRTTYGKAQRGGRPAWLFSSTRLRYLLSLAPPPLASLVGRVAEGAEMPWDETPSPAVRSKLGVSDEAAYLVDSTVNP